MVERKELVKAQREIEGLKDQLLRTEADLAKERAGGERVKADLAQALEENRRLKEIVASKEKEK